MLFQGDTLYKNVNKYQEYFIVNQIDEVETADGWKFATELSVGDILMLEDGKVILENIEQHGRSFRLFTGICRA